MDFRIHTPSQAWMELEENLNNTVSFLQGSDPNKPGRVEIHSLNEGEYERYFSKWIRRNVGKRGMYEYWSEDEHSPNEHVYFVMPAKQTCRAMHINLINISNRYIDFEEIEFEYFQTHIKQSCELIGTYTRDSRVPRTAVSGHMCGNCCKLIA